MARIIAQTLRNAGLGELSRLRRRFRSTAKNLRRLRRSPGFGHDESSVEHPDSQVFAILQAYQPQDQVSCDCLRQSVHYWEVASSHESH